VISVKLISSIHLQNACIILKAVLSQLNVVSLNHLSLFIGRDIPSPSI